MKDHLVALVTGGASGIGLATVERFISEGYKVAVFDANKSAKEVIKNNLKSEINDVFIYEVDVTNHDSILDGFKGLAKDNLTPSVLLNSAGISPPLNPLHKYEINDWNKCVSINLNGTFMVTREFINSYIENKLSKGSIINISSTSAVLGNKGQANYAAAKAGIEAMSRSLARELGSRNINVNCVAPGFIETDMTKEISDGNEDFLASQIPLGRLGKPNEIAEVVNFLTSDQANYITGQTIHVNGCLYM